MRRRGRTFAITVGLVLLGVVLWRLVGAPPARPAGISAAALTPAPTPADDRRFALLHLEIASDEAGEVIGVEMTSGDVRRGYGPNVQERPGAWTVSLLSSTGDELRFGVPDPRRVHVESEVGDRPHTTSIEPEVGFDLVVPLNDPLGRDLAVMQVLLYDDAGRLIFAAGLRDGKVVPLPLRREPAAALG